jgi:voltage-gated sodium channel
MSDPGHAPTVRPIRRRVGRAVDSPAAQVIVGLLICANAVVLGLDTSPRLEQQYGDWLEAIDWVIVRIFLIEIGLRIWARRATFFHSPWNWFDLLVVGLAMVPTDGSFSVLRILRVIRVLRVFRVARRLRIVVESFLQALPQLTSVVVLMGVFFYMFGVITTTLFGEQHAELFGSFGAALFTLFQLMTMDSATEVVLRPLMDEQPWSLAVLLPFVAIMSFVVLNFFVAILVSALEARHRAEVVTVEDPVLAELKALRHEVAELRRRIDPS